MYYISLLRLAIYIYIEFFILETDHIFDAAENISTWGSQTVFTEVNK